MSIKIVQLNIERSRHMARVVPFLCEHAPDVVTLEEVMEPDLKALCAPLGGTALFAPMMLREGVPEGVAIMSHYPITTHTITYYAGAPDLTEYIEDTAKDKHASTRYVVLVASIAAEDTMYRIGVTHFPWTPDGEADAFQREDILSLMKALEPLGELILAGDFNAPRGKEIWSHIASRYKDNVPEKYTSSIDPKLHRAKNLNLMVDGIFSTPAYTVTDVRMHTGVSDHCALVAHIAKHKT